MGEKRVGVASAEHDGCVAYPLKTVTLDRRASLDEQAKMLVSELIELEVTELVVGLPLRLDGSESSSAVRARSLGSAVAERLGVPLVLWDERLTTVSAERALSDIDIRGPRRREVIDQVAATLILQSYLDSQVQKWRDVPPRPEDENVPDPDPLPLPGGRSGTSRRSARSRRRR